MASTERDPYRTDVYLGVYSGVIGAESEALAVFPIGGAEWLSDHVLMGIRVSTRAGKNTRVSFPLWVPVLAVLCGLGLIVQLVKVLWVPLLILAGLAVLVVVGSFVSVGLRKRRAARRAE